MVSNGYEQQAEESSVKKERNNEEFVNVDDKSKSGRYTDDINCKRRDERIHEAHANVVECIGFYDHDMVKLKLYVDVIIDLNSEVKAEFYDELRRNNVHLMKSKRFGEREVDLRTGRPIQRVQMEPNENEILEEESARKECNIEEYDKYNDKSKPLHDCTGRNCYKGNCKRRNALIGEARSAVDECIRLLWHDMVKLERYIDEIIYLKSDVKADYYDELRRINGESDGIRKKRCKCHALDEKVIAESSKPMRMCKRCGEYARHDSRNCPLKYV